MNVSLSPALQRFVDEQVRTGRYVDGGEVMRQALRLMEARTLTASGDAARLDLAALFEGDIMAIAFAVMVEAAKSAQEDLKDIMAQVKAINAAKQALRELLQKVKRDLAANTPCLDDDCALDFSRGLGSERAYRRVPLPHLDPDAPGGVRMVPTDLLRGKRPRREDLRLIAEELESKLDSMSEMGETESLRLQMAMDRRSKFIEMLSNLMKKQSDTAAALIANLK